ncbi:glutamate--cysteine ligase regulatory subunit [Colletes gigas]|uniref:glutamate--cysteine ligase regulatory subunit n=1 Tax=Colletes gigas TaxID=935657 RepID=UPI001C9AB0FF|nr:glutamate--cysteine ligase regulatory subunit [Colletes gigas]
MVTGILQFLFSTMLSQNVLIQTGNILSLKEIKTKINPTPTEEIIETLKIVLQDNESSGEDPVVIKGKEDNAVQTITREKANITVKVFMSSPNVNLLTQAIDQVCDALNTSAIDSFVIAYKGKEDSEELLESLKQLWNVVEKYVAIGKLSSVGLSDVNTNEFIALFQWAYTKPNILQIGLTTCCSVPVELQKFTRINDVRLLTHCDYGQILPQEELNNLFNANVSLHWVTRYSVHLKRRGILFSKGYLVYMNKTNNI